MMTGMMCLVQESNVGTVDTAEAIAKLVSGCSMLKTHGDRLKDAVANKSCVLCDVDVVEDVNHLV